MGQIKVFLDSDVIISALLSSKGASFEIIQDKRIHKVTSTAIQAEVLEVVKRQNILPAHHQIFHGMKMIQLKLDKARIVMAYVSYVLDEEDSHVVAGAYKAAARFLLTHNLKHYHLKKIKQNFDILVMKPGTFLQYLRRNASN